MAKHFSYYDYSPVLSHNAVYNFIVGGRGLGKTYGAKKHVITRFLKYGEQFIYLRRFSKEMSVKGTFFADISDQFKGCGFRINGSEAQICRNPNDEKPNWEVAGYFHVLSRAQGMKSASYPRVTTIIFDEFILEKGFSRYLPDEATAFNNFYSTIDRWQDRTKVLFLANSVSIMNPYFTTYDIEPNREWVKKHNGFMVAHFPDSTQFASEVSKTRFGSFISGTDYEEYAVNNDFRDNANYLIGKKTEAARYHFTMETINGDFTVWVDLKEHPYTYYVQAKKPLIENIWVMDKELMSEGKLLVEYSDKHIQLLRTAYGRGNVLFESARLRNTFLRVFKR